MHQERRLDSRFCKSRTYGPSLGNGSRHSAVERRLHREAGSELPGERLGPLDVLHGAHSSEHGVRRLDVRRCASEIAAGLGAGGEEQAECDHLELGADATQGPRIGILCALICLGEGTLRAFCTLLLVEAVTVDVTITPWRPRNRRVPDRRRGPARDG